MILYMTLFMAWVVCLAVGRDCFAFFALRLMGSQITYGQSSFVIPQQGDTNHVERKLHVVMPSFRFENRGIEIMQNVTPQPYQPHVVPVHLTQHAI